MRSRFSAAPQDEYQSWGCLHTSLRLEITTFRIARYMPKSLSFSIDVPISRQHSEGVCQDMIKSEMLSMCIMTRGRVYAYPGTRLIFVVNRIKTAVWNIVVVSRLSDRWDVSACLECRQRTYEWLGVLTPSRRSLVDRVDKFPCTVDRLYCPIHIHCSI